MAALIALIAGNGTLTKGSIIALAILGAIGVSLAVWDHGWLKAPFAIGTPVRTGLFFLLIWAAWAAIGYYVWPNPALGVKFDVAIGGVVSKRERGGKWGPYVCVTDPNVLASIDYMPVIRITNRQNLNIKLKSYSLEMLDSKDGWKRLIKLPYQPKYSRLYFVHPAGYVTTMEPHEPLDFVLSEKTLIPGETVGGWGYFAYPEGFTSLSQGAAQFRITVSDYTGNREELTVKQDSTPPGSEDVPENNNSFNFGGERLDVGSFVYVNYEDTIKRR